MQTIKAELHIHSVLSPCASRENTPRELVQRCSEMEIGIAALTDHNSGENAGVFASLASEAGVFPLPGMEMETREGVHLLAFFPDLNVLQSWQDTVYDNLPRSFFALGGGLQELVASDGRKIRKKCDRPLAASSFIPLSEAVGRIHEMGGLTIPAHIDRAYKGLISQMGYIPSEIPFDGLEITSHCDLGRLVREYPEIEDFSIIRSGDAHHPEEIRGWTEFWIKEPSFAEIRLAFSGKGGRGVKIYSPR